MENFVEKMNYKMSKEEIQRITILAIKGFLVAHPDALDPNYIQSIAKRVAGQIYTHFVHNPQHNGG